ncbi:hypothetical protein DFH08DRAFT_965652 [Mycena albidolilacea]|uniref:Uncharacterized protein n=1 Tax=Mycena albidolilacea TaxID=1033008 RepID=A0AAD6ZR50_9AGAR|nr:hypothetical protein DFH08DRAFT_965652 [Mycena albidolilacea]
MSWLHQSRYPSRILSGARRPIPGGVWTIVETGQQGCAVLVDSRRRRSPDSRATALGTERTESTTLHLAYEVYDHKSSRGSSAQHRFACGVVTGRHGFATTGLGTEFTTRRCLSTPQCGVSPTPFPSQRAEVDSLPSPYDQNAACSKGLSRPQPPHMYRLRPPTYLSPVRAPARYSSLLTPPRRDAACSNAGAMDYCPPSAAAALDDRSRSVYPRGYSSEQATDAAPTPGGLQSRTVAIQGSRSQRDNSDAAWRGLVELCARPVLLLSRSPTQQATDAAEPPLTVGTRRHTSTRSQRDNSERHLPFPA